MSDVCLRVDLGRADYEDVWQLQRRLVDARKRGEIPDVLLFTEHPPTFTIGRGGDPANLLVGERGVHALGASFVRTDRGGDITFHGPGQLVGYPIFDLRGWKRDLGAYLRALEELLIQAVSEYGIRAGRIEGLTGVWHEKGKLAAMGIRVSRWVASHGFALNVSTNLEYFNHIVPCGIVGRSISSMEEVLSTPVAWDPVADAVSRAFGAVFSRDMRAIELAELEAGVH